MEEIIKIRPDVAITAETIGDKPVDDTPPSVDGHIFEDYDQQSGAVIAIQASWVGRANAPCYWSLAPQLTANVAVFWQPGYQYSDGATSVFPVASPRFGPEGTGTRWVASMVNEATDTEGNIYLSPDYPNYVEVAELIEG
jgi:hypothetical protein